MNLKCSKCNNNIDPLFADSEKMTQKMVNDINMVCFECTSKERRFKEQDIEKIQKVGHALTSLSYLMRIPYREEKLDKLVEKVNLLLEGSDETISEIECLEEKRSRLIRKEHEDDDSSIVDLFADRLGIDFLYKD